MVSEIGREEFLRRLETLLLRRLCTKFRRFVELYDPAAEDEDEDEDQEADLYSLVYSPRIT